LALHKLSEHRQARKSKPTRDIDQLDGSRHEGRRGPNTPDDTRKAKCKRVAKCCAEGLGVATLDVAWEVEP
jgi:hypothetical protein